MLQTLRYSSKILFNYTCSFSVYRDSVVMQKDLKESYTLHFVTSLSSFLIFLRNVRIGFKFPFFFL